MSRDAHVTGAAVTAFGRRRDGSGFRDWAVQAGRAAIADAGVEPPAIGAMILASESDFFTLQLNPASVVADDLGLAGAATMRVEGGGASGQLAVQAGARAIRAGQAEHVLVLGVDPSASQLSGDAVRTLYGYSFDAWTDGITGLTSTALYALSFQAFAERTGAGAADLAAVTIANRGNARRNPNAHLGRDHTAKEIDASPMIASPYRRLHCSPLSDGAAALVLSAGPRPGAPRVAGIGAASDRARLGARPDPGRFAAKTAAMRRAGAEAGIGPGAIDAAELYDAYAGAQLQAIEALGLSEDPARDLRAGRFARGGALPVNLSGGLMGQGAPVGATGVGQVATCAMILTGRYHAGLQPAAPPRYALADTHGGIATTATVTILEAP